MEPERKVLTIEKKFQLFINVSFLQIQLLSLHTISLSSHFMLLTWWFYSSLCNTQCTAMHWHFLKVAIITYRKLCICCKSLLLWVNAMFVLLISGTEWRSERAPHAQKAFFFSSENTYLMSCPIQLDTFLCLLCFRISAELQPCISPLRALCIKHI